MHAIPSNDLPLRAGAPASPTSTDAADHAPAAPVAVEVVVPSQPMDDPITALEKLPVPQQNAIDALLSGGSVTDAAGRAGVTRTTIYRWLNNDPQFKSIYARWQEHLRATSRARLMMLSESAVDVLHDALDQSDRNVAFGLLKHMGVLSKKE